MFSSSRHKVDRRDYSRRREQISQGSQAERHTPPWQLSIPLQRLAIVAIDVALARRHAVTVTGRAVGVELLDLLPVNTRP